MSSAPSSCAIPDVAKISFTGSVGVGETIMRDGAKTMKRVTLELGGKSPTILLDDAALDKAIPSALVMAFMNSGQACAAGTRLLVPKSRLDEVKRAIRDAMRVLYRRRPGRSQDRGRADGVAEAVRARAVLYPQGHRGRRGGARRRGGSSRRLRSGLTS